MTPTEHTEAVIAEVRAEMGRQGVNLTRLAAATGIQQSSLSRKMRGESPLLFVDLLLICEALQVTFATLLRRVDDLAAA